MGVQRATNGAKPTTTSSVTAATSSLATATKPTIATPTTTAAAPKDTDRFEAIPDAKVLGGPSAPKLGGIPDAIADDVKDLSPAGQMALTKLFHVYGGHQDVVDHMVETLENPALWPATMRPNDEQYILQSAMACAPLSTQLAKPPLVDGVAIVTAKTDGSTAVNNAEAQLVAAWHGGEDIVMAPEWFFVPNDGVALTAKDKDALLDRLAVLTKGSDRLLVPGTIPWADDDGGYHNTAFAISNGKVIHSVDKRGDGDDVGIAKGAGLTHVSEPGSSVFSWRGADVGLEVCRDHGDARLRFDLLGTRRDVVDLHLVVSSGVWLKHAAVGVGGDIYVAQGDGIAGHEHGHRPATGTGTDPEGRLVVEAFPIAKD